MRLRFLKRKQPELGFDLIRCRLETRLMIDAGRLILYRNHPRLPEEARMANLLGIGHSLLRASRHQQAIIPRQRHNSR